MTKTFEDAPSVRLRLVSHAPTRRVALPLALALIVAIAAVAGALSASPVAAAGEPTCGSAGVTVTPQHSPDGVTRPFYADFGNSSTNHSGYVGYELSGGALGADVWIKLSGFTGGKLGLAARQSQSIPARGTSQGGKPLVYAYLTATGVTTTAQTFTVEVWNGKPGASGSTEVCSAGDGFSRVVDVISANANKITAISLSNATPALGGSFEVTALGNTGTMGAGPSSDQVAGNGVFSMAPAMTDSWPADAFTLTGATLTLQGTTTNDRLRVYPTSSAASSYTAVYKFTVRARTSGPTAVYPVQNIASGTQVKYTGSYPSDVSVIAAPVLSATVSKTASALTGSGPYLVTYAVELRNSSGGPVVVDALDDTPTGSWAFVAGSATLGGAAVADPASDGTSLRFSGPITVPSASGGSDGTIVLRYTLSVAGQISNSITAKVGDETIAGTSGGNQVTVDPAAPIITTGSLADGTAGTAYTQTVAASSGTPAYAWSITAGSLPAGLTLDLSSGEIGGTPTTPGTSTFEVTVTDVKGKTAAKTYGVTIDSPSSPPAPPAPPAQSHVLSVAVAGSGDGAVTADMGAIDCGAICSDAYADGTAVTLTATAASGSSFAGWSGACSGTSPTCTLTVDAAQSVTATFVPASTPPAPTPPQDPDPQPEPGPDPEPDPTPTPPQDPDPQPEPGPDPEPDPTPTPPQDPDPQPEPGPDREPDPTPTPPQETEPDTDTPGAEPAPAQTNEPEPGDERGDEPADKPGDERADEPGEEPGEEPQPERTPVSDPVPASTPPAVAIPRPRTATAPLAPVSVTTSLADGRVVTGGSTGLAVRLANPNDTPQTLTVTVQLPTGVAVASTGGGRATGRTITWRVTVPANASVTLNARVAVSGPVRRAGFETSVSGARTSKSRAATPQLRIGGVIAVVYFRTDSVRLTRAARSTLVKARRGIVANGFRTATLTCHTDSVGSLAYNYALSRRRCATVATYLTRHLGITKVIYRQSSFAFLQPARSNATRVGKAANRRVEIRVS